LQAVSNVELAVMVTPGMALALALAVVVARLQVRCIMFYVA
jgi:hypothetical protein